MDHELQQGMMRLIDSDLFAGLPTERQIFQYIFDQGQNYSKRVSAKTLGKVFQLPERRVRGAINKLGKVLRQHYRQSGEEDNVRFTLIRWGRGYEIDVTRFRSPLDETEDDSSPYDVRRHFGSRLSSLRKKLGMSRRELAAAAGISQK